MRHAFMGFFMGFIALLLIPPPPAWARLHWFEYRRYKRSDFTLALTYHDGQGRTLAKAIKEVGGHYGTAAGYFAPAQWRNVDLTVLQGEAVRPYLVQYGRPVLAVRTNGEITIFRPKRGAAWRAPANWWFAIAGDHKVTGNLKRETIRQIVALKGNEFFVFKIRGSYWDCKGLMKRWGISHYLFLDGASTAARGARAPSHLIAISKKRFLQNVHNVRLARMQGRSV
ncbi:MAG: hypothetical protein M3347_18265 [Armatimonadota bacterium]|nr:hypothetical protein [Armatimonadota bacterium]